MFVPKYLMLSIFVLIFYKMAAPEVERKCRVNFYLILNFISGLATRIYLILIKNLLRIKVIQFVPVNS